ncbi:AraC family transcriptional regulator [Shimazuella sp. AN120528]|uniref:AraC family transcriptional regulator n=1 Tax=Shimazuella soli TaxID=1892854 RepID=UPI001F0DD03F|nr:AraC family transcriptional regulator [Shimazuella soli]MCH5585753.1 AraC family transcriptional regulator [Shimazuella soli]
MMDVRNSVIVKAPQALSKPPYNQSILKLNGLSVIESCTHTQGAKGSMFLEDHLLLFVLEGIYKVRFGNQEYTVRKNEMLLLQKSIVVEYEKSGDPDAEYKLDYMIFFLAEDVLREFLKMADYKPVYPALLVPVSVHQVNDRLVSYLHSLNPYFKELEKINDGLVKLKLLELLFDVADADEQFLLQFLQLKRKERRDIAEVVEENYMNPVSISDLAYLSGRSLSAFKREFQAMYNTSPLQWIRNRRLDKAEELLTHSNLSVTDICFTIGFENVAHFSKVFKNRFGYPPSALKKA